MTFLKKLFGQKGSSSAKPPASTSKGGIATLLRVCSSRGWRLISLEEDPTFNQAVEELKREGPKGAQALAALMDELLAARCAEILDALAAARRLPPQPELINAIQKIISAPPVIVGQPGRFAPVIIGGGRIGWDDGFAARIKKRASEVLAEYEAHSTSVKSPSSAPTTTSEAEATPQKSNTTPSAEDRIEDFEAALRRFVDNREDGFRIQRMASDLGELAIPSLTRRLTDDRNGSNGRAAAIALEDLSPSLALPLVAMAFESSYRGVRYFAVEYVVKHKGDPSVIELARKQMQVEKDEELRGRLAKWF